jgi:hypothetical protein
MQVPPFADNRYLQMFAASRKKRLRLARCEGGVAAEFLPFAEDRISLSSVLNNKTGGTNG